MATIVHQNIADGIQLLPLRFLSIYTYDGSVYGDPVFFLNLYQLESESSFTLTPITKQTSNGTQRVLGYNGNIIIYLPFNKYGSNELLSQIDSIQSLDKSVLLGFGEVTPWSDGTTTTPPAVYNATSGMFLRIDEAIEFPQYHVPEIEIVVEIESVQFRPRTILRVNFFKKYISSIFI